MKKIKICFIISKLNIGGAERQLIELIKNLDQSNFEITLLIYNSKESFYRNSLPDNIRVAERKLFSKNKLLKIIEAQRIVYNFLKSHEFDIVHTTLFMNGVIVRLATPKKFNNRIISSIRNNLESFNFIYKKIEKMLLKKSFVIANSLTAKEQFQKIVQEQLRAKIFHVYNGIDNLRFRPCKKNIESITIGNVGRMERQKNQLQLLKAFTALQNFDVKLILIGSKGAESAKIYKFVDKNNLCESITILNEKENIEEFYNKINIFVLPSHWEGCPNVLFEAMLSKCICIINQRANTDGFIKHGINGFVYNGTNKDLVNKLSLAISKIRSEDVDSILDSAYIYAKENFSIKAMVDNYSQLYLKLHQNGYCNN